MRRGISGTHRMNGIYMAYGAAIEAGSEAIDASLVDLAPTILRLMGEPVADHMDGRVLTETLSSERALPPAAAQTCTPQASNDAAIHGSVMSEEDQKLLAERLRSLGYVG